VWNLASWPLPPPRWRRATNAGMFSLAKRFVRGKKERSQH
jgi:hypothetical protein